MSETTRRFSREQLTAWGLPKAARPAPGEVYKPVILHREATDQRRWTQVYELVFRAPDDGKTWMVAYEEGLTEYQDDTDPWFGEPDVEAELVVRRDVMVTRWVAVSEDGS